MVFTLTHRRLAAGVCLLGLLVLPGCDDGPKQLEKAKARYVELVDRGVPPRDPAWDEVITALEAIPKDSKAWPEAEQRLEALRTLKGRKLPSRPLATPGVTGPGADAVEAQRAECERLAKELGTAAEERREEVSRALGACREKLVRLEAAAHPPGEGGHEHQQE
ncbi:hypothetical protein [Hyalangium sp.]|uniref:hypothetical protein n=1 Tax=Hyalangium sp. TaxID=2028555 RepID=UPI002D29D0FB|nr:hypothetical protein [Hyalangium sp.]HYH96868.1 hypothetical protein [Hyalangium sp.]